MPIIINFGTLFVEPDYYSVLEDGTLTEPAASGLLLNDYATNGAVDAVSYTSPGHGTVSLDQDGSFTYTPIAGFAGVDTFTYTAGSGILRNTATVTIDVIQPLLVATPDTYVMQAGGTLTVNAANGLLANDYTAGGSIEATNFSNASHGTVSLDEDGSFTYTPNAGYVGTDSFTYYISNGYGTASATDTIDVVDAAPVANNDYYAVRAGQTLTIAAAHGLLANDIGFGKTIDATNFSNATHGTVSLDEDGSFTYVPNSGYVGADSFTYYISDGTETASATVHFDVVDTAPVAAADFYHLAENSSLTVAAANGLLKNDFDADGDTITATNFSNAAHGTTSLDEDGSFTYTPNTGYVGTDTFTYYISDGAETASATVSLQVGLTGVTANPDTYSIVEGGTLTVAAANGLLVNDYATNDRRGFSLIATNFSNPNHGALSLDEDGSFTYTPNAGYVGADTFTYYIGNGIGTASATDTIDVIVPALVANPDVYLVNAGGSLTVGAAKGLLANDITTGGTLEATNFSDASHGSLSLDEDGSFTYTPNAGYVGTDTFTYYISNGYGSASATDTIDVVDAAPTANADHYTVHAGQSLHIAAAHGLLANDIDPGGTLIATNFSNTTHGALSLDEDGSFTYTPNAGYTGTDTATYYISDGTEKTSAVVSFDVVDTAPVANPDYYFTTENSNLTVTAAHGLLLNDFDPDGDTIIATNFSDTAHGVFSLDEDGSFTYTPDSGYTGADTATYYISDGTETASASVNIQVIACYAEGTRIGTPRGKVAVEQLRQGDTVTTLAGEARPIIWIGRRGIDCRRHPEPSVVQPVRVMAHAFGPGLPERDLFLSPDHAVFVEEVLIPIKYLIDGAAIVQEARDEVTYWHIELERHNVILADGLPCESYLDTNNRAAFVNGGGTAQMFPDFGPGEGCEAIREAAGFAPMRIEGAALARVDAKLRRRARRLGYALVRKTQRRRVRCNVAANDFTQLLQPLWYLSAYPDIAAAGVDPAKHYSEWGRVEGRLPCLEIELVRTLGLIDPDTLVITMADVVAAGVDPVDHFCNVGWRERRRPNPYFDTGWYLDTHDVPTDMNPLLHYVLLGENLGLAPSRHFDPIWYRQRHAIGPAESPLVHYLQRRRTQHYSPLPTFDVATYVQEHAATLLPGRDPYAHFLAIGQFAKEPVCHTARIAA